MNNYAPGLALNEKACESNAIQDLRDTGAAL